MKSRKLTYVGAVTFTVMKSTMLLLIAVVTLTATLALSNPLAAQDKQDHLHRTLGAGNDPTATQSQSSALGGGGSSDLNYWSLLSQVVDDQNGAPSVDPLSLQPPAILNNDNPAANPSGNYHTYKACWKVDHPRATGPAGYGHQVLQQSCDVRDGRREPREQPQWQPRRDVWRLTVCLDRHAAVSMGRPTLRLLERRSLLQRKRTADRGLSPRSLCRQDL